MLEKKPLEKVSQKNQLMAYKHENFWQCMDTLRDKNLLNKLIKNNKAPWIK
jgi:glucose-1-phosphate cytidylyltransferase